jgi:hypothetical protein
MRSDRPPPALLVTAFGVPMLAYAYTLAPSLGYIDWGELAAVACTFGIAHPTGYPLFTLLAGAWAHLPLAGLGSAALRVNLFSALLSAAAVAVCADLAWRLLARAGFRPLARESGALTAAGVFAFDRAVWGDALAIEVHSLHALLLLLVLNAVARAAATPEALRGWRVAACLLGLSFANHLTTVQLLPGLLLVCLGVFVPRYGWRGLATLLLPFAIGLLPYAYIPIRGTQDPRVSWGDPTSVVGLWRHVTAHEYGGRFFMGVGAFLSSLGGFVSGLPAELGPLALLLAPLGGWTVVRREPGMTAVLALFLATSVGVAANYAIPDIGPYFVLAYLTLALLAGFAVASVCAQLPARRAPGLALAASVVAVTLVANVSVSERGDYLVEDFTENMFRSLAKDAVVISYQWDHWTAPALFAQSVLGTRPDVLSIDKRLCQRGWYLRQLGRRHPEVFDAIRPELDRAIARAEATGTPTPDGAVALSAAIDVLLQALVDAQSPRRPVYVTMDVEEAFPRGYRQVPEGLALRLYPPDRLPPPDQPVWDAFAYRPFPRRDPWTDRLRQYYAVMLMARGAWLEAGARPGAAAAYYERALPFDPSPDVRRQIQQRLARARAAAAP